MTSNVSQVNLHQSLSSGSSIVNPVLQDGVSTQINGAWYALLFAVEFVGNTTRLQVAPIYQSGAFTLYAAYEDGKLVKMAIVNLEFWSSSSLTERPRMAKALRLPGEVKSVEMRTLTGSSSDGHKNITWDGLTWDVNDDEFSMVMGNQSMVLLTPETGGLLNVSVGASEAALLNFRY